MTTGQYDVLHVKGDVDCQHILPRAPFQIQQGSHILSGTGAPNANAGVNGDFYFRRDGSTNTHIYFKASGSWTGLI